MLAAVTGKATGCEVRRAKTDKKEEARVRASLMFAVRRKKGIRPSRRRLPTTTFATVLFSGWECEVSSTPPESRETLWKLR